VVAVNVNLDVNVIVVLFAIDPLNDRVEKAIRQLHDSPIVRNLSAAEFSAVIARRVRTRDLRPGEAKTAFANFDLWSARQTRIVEIESKDVATAVTLMRRLDFPLRTPDALHIAIAQRIDCALLTFDTAMARVARAIGVEVVKTPA
jgi:uncharacterized protein